MIKEKTYWYDLKPNDDNKGFIYGINYIDNDEDEVNGLKQNKREIKK
jgi:hypothetical protein